MSGKCQVEIDIAETLQWGTTIVSRPEEPMLMRQDEGRWILRGIVEDVDATDSGGSQATAFRLGDGVLLLKTKGEPLHVGQHVEVHAKDLTLYDMNV